MARSFTDERVPSAIQLGRLSESDCAIVGKRLGLSTADPQQLAQRLSDRAFLRSRLLQLPALCLVTLETLLEGGGVLHDAALHGLVRARTGCRSSQIAAALTLLFESGLAFGLSWATGAPRGQAGVPGPAAQPLHELLAGVSLPHEAPPGEASAGETRRGHRDLLALVTLTAHRRPRLTQRGLPDRGSIKRLAKGLGIEVDRVEHALSVATGLGWMAGTHDGIAPSARSLLEAVDGMLAASGHDLLRCISLIGADGWTSVEALARALWSAAYRDSAFYMGLVPVPEVETIAKQLAELPGLQVAEHAGTQWVRRVRPAHAGGDGHVTPSFEVLLGPGADLATVVRVGLCCELVRADHVLTLRLTPQSVAVGLACGLEANELRTALAGVGPHGLPENVAFMLDDWIKASRIAHVRRGTFLFTDDASAERIAAGLGADLLSRPAPGVVELPASLTGSALERILSKAGIALGASGSLDELASQRRMERYAAAPEAFDLPAKRPLPPLPEPDAELRAAVLRARETGDYGVEAPAPDQSHGLLGELEAMARTQGAPAELFELLALLRKWQKRLPDELRAWIGRMPKLRRVEAETALELPIHVLPWLLLNDKWRSRTLKTASDLASLNRQAQAVSRAGRLRKEGDRAIALLQQPRLVAAIDRALEALAAKEDDDVTGEVCEHCGRRHGIDDFDELDELDEMEGCAGDELDAALQLHAATMRRQPPLGTMPPTPPEAVRELVDKAVKTERPVHLEVSDHGRRRVYSVIPEALRRRGRDEVLLATDLESLDSRVFKLEDISAARVDAE